MNFNFSFQCSSSKKKNKQRKRKQMRDKKRVVVKGAEAFEFTTSYRIEIIQQDNKKYNKKLST